MYQKIRLKALTRAEIMQFINPGFRGKSLNIKSAFYKPHLR